MQDYWVLLRFVISVSFADHHKLGWDPTMTRTSRDGEVQYDITVRSAEAETAVYRTIGVLSDRGAERLLGRGTRVWKAVKLVDGEEIGDPVALKDTWVDSNRDREGDILSQVLQSDFVAKEHKELEKYFITAHTHGDVFVADVQDHTPTFLYPDPAPYSKGSVCLATRPISSSRVRLTGFQVHYRIVYTEVGESLAETTSLHTVFKALEDAIYGMLKSL